MDRRQFLKQQALAGTLGLLPFLSKVAVARTAVTGTVAAARPRLIHTVTGAIQPSQLGKTLMHEHVLVDFVGADRVHRNRYNEDEVYATALPYLKQIRDLGCITLVDCTPSYIGKNPALLRRLAEASGLQIITNTGYYGAAKDQFIPAHAYRETAEELAARWVREFEEGIEGTGIRPGFVKTGIDSGPLSEIDAKLIRAAAQTHLRTGLAVAVHSGDGTAALAALKLFAEERAPAHAFLWVHAQNEPDLEKHLRAARAGAWVEFDGIRPETVARHVELAENMRAHALLDRTLVSQDAGWYHVGEPGGGNFRSYETLFTRFIPSARKAGFTENDLEMLLTANPIQALLTQPRLLR